ncbi:ABC transporter permease [Gulosibacter molinativorax]|uniref:ABC transporter permease n=1 Tax=Gulosibacter molinativorax TaxID=256821 RepID=A0ABT7C666_9MICO|nr:ABC transporter permease [Gulosibacter molinativorax]MDJ1370701.1 ABC transporter permease [Gulosibacter molinativorax]QUY63273.1 Binding--dependent transport system inner membrane component family protein [Gulosibacter molinativorax]
MTLKRVLGVLSVLTIIWLLVPTLVIIPMSFNEAQSFNFPPKGFSTRWYENFFTNGVWLKSLGNSFLIAILTAIIATTLGVLACLGLIRLKPRARGIFENLFLAPMIVPGIVLAIGLYSIYLRLQSSTGFLWLGTLQGFVFAHVILALPLVITNVMASLQGVDDRLGQAAASLGASRMTTFFTVTLPLIIPGVTAGALFAFVTSFDEIILSLFIQTPNMQTLPVQLFNSVRQSNDPTVAAVAVVMMVLSLLVLLAAQSATRKRKVKA